MSALPIAPGEWDWLRLLSSTNGQTSGSGFVPGTSDTLDWLNFLGPGVAAGVGGLVGGPIGAALGGATSDLFGFLSQQRAQDQARDAQRRANAANEARFAQILGLNTQRQQLGQQQLNATGEQLAQQRRQMLGAVGQAGQSARRDIMANQTAQMGAAVQDAQRRGLAGTSVLPNMRRAVASDTNRSLADLSERTGMARANVLGDNSLANFMQDRTRFESGLLQDRSDIIERRQDVADMNQLLPLLMQSRGGGSGGGKSGIGGLLGGIVGGIGSILGGI